MFYETKSNQHGLPHDPYLSCIVPRPIGWITTLDRDGGLNLAPFSFFNGVASNPRQVMFGAGNQHVEGGVTDTQKNAEDTGEFVANMVTWEVRDQMNVTSEHVARSVDEAALAGPELEPSQLVKPPRVKASPIHLECVYLQTVELEAEDPLWPNFMVIGKVIGVHIRDEVLTDGIVDLSKFTPLARLGYMDYSVVNNTFTLAFPDFDPDYKWYGLRDDKPEGKGTPADRA